MTKRKTFLLLLSLLIVVFVNVYGQEEKSPKQDIVYCSRLKAFIPPNKNFIIRFNNEKLWTCGRIVASTNEALILKYKDDDGKEYLKYALISNIAFITEMKEED